MATKLTPYTLKNVPGTVHEGLRLERNLVQLSGSYYEETPSIVRACELRNCRLQARSAANTLFEDCLFEDLGTQGKATLVGCKFQRCVFRGACGDFFITRLEIGLSYSEHDDWALDLRAATFKNLDLRRVPGRLLRLDPETQLAVNRAQVPANWRSLGLDELFEITLEDLEDDVYEDALLIVERGSEAQRRDIAKLRALLGADQAPR